MTRLNPTQRRKMIVHAAYLVARDTGLKSVNHSTVCNRCPVPTSKTTLKTHFPKIALLQLAVLDEQNTTLVEGLKLMGQAKALGLV